MENISEALKMAGAALLFILAFTITLMLFSQAKSTAEYVLFATDKTNFYPQIKANTENVTREVGIETIIPTLYRYRQEGFAVRICKEDGEELQVFDAALESFINTHSFLTLTDEEKRTYGKYYEENKNVYMAGAPWASGDTNNSKLLERINSYIYGSPNSFGIDYKNNNLIEEYNRTSF